MRWLLTTLATCVASSASAHPLDLSTARVTLRDSHAEVLVQFDPIGLLAHSAPSAPDATALATTTEPQLSNFVASVRAALEAQAYLDVDGVAVPMVLRAFPEPDELRAWAAEVSAGAPGGLPRAVMVFETTREVVDARSLRLQLAPSLGPVLFSFVQPTSQLATAGAPATFEVLRPSKHVVLSGSEGLVIIAALMAMMYGLARRSKLRGGRAK